MMNGYTHLPASQQRFLFWFNGLAPVATNVVTPLVTYAQLRHKVVSPMERRSLVVQETVRQVLSGVIGVTTYFGGAWLTGRMMGSHAAKSLGQIVGGTVASFIGYAFIRPLVSTELIVRWLRRFQQEEAAGKNLSPMPEMRMRTFLQNVEGRATQFRGLGFRGWA
jgi:hypothetical protein